MTLVAAVVLVVAATTLFTLFVRAKDIPAPDPVSPTQHLDERKAAIYENLRDLQFEYRVGKLSDADYQQTKLALQKELATVLAEIDLTAQAVPVKAATAAKAATAKSKPAPGTVCPHCGAKFSNSMKFCGECGKAMAS
jgi:rRNA maturation endonuclease Nob1